MRICRQFYMTKNKKKELCWLNKFNFTPQACCRIFKQRKLCVCVTVYSAWLLEHWYLLLTCANKNEVWYNYQLLECTSNTNRDALIHVSEGKEQRETEQNSDTAFMFPCYTSDSLSLLQTQIFAGFSHVLHKVVWFWLPAPRWRFLPLGHPCEKGSQAWVRQQD